MWLLYWLEWSRLALFTCLMVDACYGLGHCLQKILLHLITWHLGSKSIRKREALMCNCFFISTCGTTANVPLLTASHSPSISVGETVQERAYGGWRWDLLELSLQYFPFVIFGSLLKPYFQHFSHLWSELFWNDCSVPFVSWLLLLKKIRFPSWISFFSPVTQSCPTLCSSMDCTTPRFPVHHQLLAVAQTHVHRIGDAIQSSHPLSSTSPPPSIFPSIRVFSSESVLHFRWPKYWSFSISPSSEYSGLISFRMDSFWISLQSTGLSRVFSNTTVKSINFLALSFLMVQCSHPYMTTGKTTALTRWTFVGKVMSLLFNMLSRLVIAFLPRSEHLLISWLQSPSAVILDPKKIKSVTVSTVSPSISHEVMGPDAMILVFWMLSFKPTFSLSFFTFIKRLFSSSSLSAIRVVSSAYLRLFISPGNLDSSLCFIQPSVSHDVLCI